MLADCVSVYVFCVMFLSSPYSFDALSLSRSIVVQNAHTVVMMVALFCIFSHLLLIRHTKAYNRQIPIHSHRTTGHCMHILHLRTSENGIEMTFFINSLCRLLRRFNATFRHILILTDSVSVDWLFYSHWLSRFSLVFALCLFSTVYFARFHIFFSLVSFRSYAFIVITEIQILHVHPYGYRLDLFRLILLSPFENGILFMIAIMCVRYYCFIGKWREKCKDSLSCQRFQRKKGQICHGIVLMQEVVSDSLKGTIYCLLYHHHISVHPLQIWNL